MTHSDTHRPAVFGLCVNDVCVTSCFISNLGMRLSSMKAIVIFNE